MLTYELALTYGFEQIMWYPVSKWPTRKVFCVVLYNFCSSLLQNRCSYASKNWCICCVVLYMYWCNSLWDKLCHILYVRYGRVQRLLITFVSCLLPHDASCQEWVMGSSREFVCHMTLRCSQPGCSPNLNIIDHKLGKITLKCNQ